MIIPVRTKFQYLSLKFLDLSVAFQRIFFSEIFLGGQDLSAVLFWEPQMTIAYTDIKKKKKTASVKTVVTGFVLPAKKNAVWTSMRRQVYFDKTLVIFFHCANL